MKFRNKKSIFVSPLESAVQSLEISLAKGGDAFWLDSRTVGHVVEDEEEKVLKLYALSLKFETEELPNVLHTPEPPTLIGAFPTASAANFRYSLSSRHLVFSSYVYPDGNLSTVKERDEAWENRGTSALVYDSTYVRHWDTWVGPKASSLFSVQLTSDVDHKWTLGSEYINLLKDTGHVCPSNVRISLVPLKHSL
jgi:hypothetical protein